MKNKIREENKQKIWRAMPGTTRSISIETGISRGTVRKYIRAWLDTGLIQQKTRWLGKNSYTFVYYIKCC